MDITSREGIEPKAYCGRHIWRVMGADAPWGDDMSCGFARFTLADGNMKAHKHERELIYVIDAKGAKARFGAAQDKMDQQRALHGGDLLRFGEDEWHIFELADEDAYLDIFWVFSVPQNHTVDAC